MLRRLGWISLPSDELVELFANNKVATLNGVGLLLTIIGVLLLFKRQHRYDWWKLGRPCLYPGGYCLAFYR
jgi:hypothetical protein